MSSSALHDARALTHDDRAFAHALSGLIKRFPAVTHVGEFLLETAKDPRPHIRSIALAGLASFSDLIDRSLPLLSAALLDPGGGYGGGFDESIQCDALRTIRYMGPRASSLIPDLKRAYATSFLDGNQASALVATLIDVAGPEDTARFLFDRAIKQGRGPATAADDVMLAWPESIAFPKFLRKHPDPAIQTQVHAQRELERSIDAELEAMRKKVRMPHHPRPWPDD